MDAELLVRTRAAEFLGLIGEGDPVTVLTQALQAANDKTTANLILNTITLLRDTRPELQFKLRREMVPDAWIAQPNDLVSRRLQYLIPDEN